MVIRNDGLQNIRRWDMGVQLISLYFNGVRCTMVTTDYLVWIVMYMRVETNVRWVCSRSRNSSATGGRPPLIPSRGRSTIFGRCAVPTRHIWPVAKCKVWCVRTAKTMIYDKNWRMSSVRCRNEDTWAWARIFTKSNALMEIRVEVRIRKKQIR